ncbi:MAG: hypothetical protein AAF754_16400 [Pseudomonadota bacterium]
MFRVRSVAVIASVVGLLCANAVQASQDSRWFGSFAGTLRLPNSNQGEDQDNAFGEVLGKVGFALSETQKGRLAVFAHTILSTDSSGASFNNVNKAGVGVEYRWRVSKPLTLTFSARYDWSERRPTGLAREGARFQINAFYFRYWHGGGKETRLGLPVHSTVFKAYGSLYAPGSMAPGDDNVVLSYGAEVSERLDLPNVKWRVALFADLVGSWDADKNSFNNKIIPALGIRLERPLPGGSFFVGARLRADWRYVNRTLDIEPGLSLGWFRTF